MWIDELTTWYFPFWHGRQETMDNNRESGYDRIAMDTVVVNLLQSTITILIVNYDANQILYSSSADRKFISTVACRNQHVE